MMPEAMIDSNVLLDVITEDPQWFAWSSEMLAKVADDHVLALNPIGYAEISLRFERIEELAALIAESGIERRPLPWEAAFLAGKCFLRYRQLGGKRQSTLPDFFIGAHAAIERMTLVTRDAARYRTYFPKLQVISPD